MRKGGFFFPSFGCRSDPLPLRLIAAATDLLTSQQICFILYASEVTSQELKRFLQKQGCTFEAGRGGHLTVRLGDKVSTLPMHGNKRDLPTGTVNAILKALDLKK